MDLDHSEHEVHGADKNSFWYSNDCVTNEGKTAEVHIFADSIKTANAIGTGIAIAKGHHMNKGAKYNGTKADYESTF